ncbi:MAG TPA: MerR family transcriptional regulator [Pilimelia sp.]|nr:MerR family transcriptional regulator [Pilimelia sp.]
MSIGEVLAHLRAEFPDATISKLRFLEAEGLVEPQRTPAGYRKYSWDDVARLRYVLTAQRDHYLPLKVIREHLAAMADGAPPPVGHTRPLAAVGSAAAPPAAEAPDGRLSRAELLARSGATEETLAALEQHGLVGAPPGGWYDGDALVIVGVAVELADYGIEPRHLRAYRVAADREVGLYAQLVAPLARPREPAARARAAEAVRELVALSQRLHGALIRAGLRDTLGH